MLRISAGGLLALAALALTACSTGESTGAEVATRVTIVTQPSADAASGVALAQQPAVRLVDDKGKPVAEPNVTVDASIASGGGLLTGTHVISTDSAGIAAFSDLRLSGVAGERTLVFSASSLEPATSSVVSLGAGPARAVTAAAPAAAVALTPFSVTVSLTDGDGNAAIVTGAPATVTLSVASGTGTLSATTTGSIPIGASGATLSGVQYSKVESGVVLRATLTGTGSSAAGLSGTTPRFTVAAPAPTQLQVGAIATQTSGVPFDVTVTLADDAGRPAGNTGATGTVTLGVLTGTGTLGGTKSVSIPVGSSSATIPGVQYTGAGSGVSLSATGSGAGSAIDGLTGNSNTFAVLGVGACGDAGTQTLASLSRDAGSALGGDTLTLIGTGFTSVAASCVQFGTDTALAIAFVSTTKLRVTAPPHGAGKVSVSVTQNGVTRTLSNAFEYLPAPTVTWTNVDFEDGTFGMLSSDHTSNTTITVDNTVAHAGTRSAKFNVPSGGGTNTYAISQLLDDYGGLWNLMLSSPTGVYHRWYERIPQSSLDNVQVATDAQSAQIKIHLDRVNNTDTPSPWLVLGIGDAFGSATAGEIVVQNDKRTEWLANTGFVIPGGQWVEYQLWYRRTGGMGYAKLWINGKLMFSGSDAQLGSDVTTAAYTWQLGIPFTQNNGRAIQMWVDDVVVSNGYISP